MSDEQRSRRPLEMTEFVREITKAGIRRDHPDWTVRQINMEILRRALWPDRFRGSCIQRLADETPQTYLSKAGN